MNRTLRLLLLLPLFLPACKDNPVEPDGFTGRTGGCADFQVYRFNGTMTDAVVVQGKGEELGFDRTPREFSLPDPRLDVRIERFSGAANSHYCDDVLDSSEPKVTRVWTAVAGTVRIASGDTLQPDLPGIPIYNIRVSLHNVTFRDGNGDEVRIDSLDYGEIQVGWLPG